MKTLGFTQAELALPVARLSGGQQRRTALLRALLCQPVQTLLLDEPFTGMDPDTLQRAAALLRETDLSVAEIAGQVGYESQSKFTATFKEQFGQLPKEYRRN